jgi:2-polyprenyl-3-methyl-5-hydroxy-6-metoxy-1,4-benzoquinol methylase
LKKIICKDYTVTGEKFELIYNSEFDMFVTTPKPDKNDLGKYYNSENYISHTDANKTLFEKIYQLVKSYSLRKKVKLINTFDLQGKKLLDVGCGTGSFLQKATNSNWQVSGVEPNKDARNIAEQKLPKKASLYKSLENLVSNAKPNSFDVITLWHVLEHVSDLDAYIKNLKTLLKPKGILLVAVPNYKSYDAIYYHEFWAAYDVPRHLWHFSQNSIKRLFQEHQMKLIKVLPMKFDSYYVALLSEKYQKGKSNPFTAFKIGFLSNLKAKKSGEYSSLIYLLKKE